LEEIFGAARLRGLSLVIMEKDEAQEAGKTDEQDGINRREFLQVLGASFAVAGCQFRPPEEKVIPYLEQPEGVVPGLARFYASTCTACPAACGVLVKTRDGRPIKLEGNSEHPLSRGGLCARGQAGVLDLYDSERFRAPQIGGKESSWLELDQEMAAHLKKAGRGLRIVTRTLTSPTMRAAASALLKKHPGSKRVAYEAEPAAAILDAHKETHGVRRLPRYHFNKARAIVSFGADFLGTWIAPVEFTKEWSTNRQPDHEWEMMSWHAQFEARMSLTGANADMRMSLKPSQRFNALVALGHHVADQLKSKTPRPRLVGVPQKASARIADAARMLVREKGRSLVVSDAPDVATQSVVNWINEILGAYGATIDLQHPSFQAEGSDAELAALISDMQEGRVTTLIVCGANPAQDHPRAKAFAAAMAKVPMTVSLATRADETSQLCRLVAPDHHALESWGDSQPGSGLVSLLQPTVAPLFNTRAAVESLTGWAGRRRGAYSFLRDRWQREVLAGKKGSFEKLWDQALHDGFIETSNRKLSAGKYRPAAVLRSKASGNTGEGFEFVGFMSPSIGSGAQANNPWLQELPDPITRATWGNAASFAPADAQRLGLVEGRVVRISAGQDSVELPAHIQPGQAEGTVAAAVGYGRVGAGKIAANYPRVKMLPVDKELLGGADVYPLMSGGPVAVSVLGKMDPLAKVQTFDSLTDPITGHKRPMVQETTLQDFFSDPTSGREPLPEGAALWPKHEYKGHKWAMAIDLNACTGCSGCVVACQAENNVPIVGKAEVRKSRDMAWMRIDRYYGNEEESPSVAFQPMLCQHCDNAPCETVCPVLATLHSTEGQNMQVYNRCVGTRYCANNCPYKVRRFNWFDYAHEDLVQNLALNPDITVRSRGIMEKCSFCVQRTQEAKATAKVEDRMLKDGDARVACQQSCPADAIIFGDINDPKSQIAKAAKNPRGYTVLGELGVGPSIFYMTKVRNKKA
jgi:Fe-S-cluster-containing dehydrogenase component/anaerobic selenocysteine-containing dehydrogenase